MAADRRSRSQRLVDIGYETGDLHGYETVWLAPNVFVKTNRPGAAFHVSLVGKHSSFCGAAVNPGTGQRVARRNLLDMFLCLACVKALEALAETALVDAVERAVDDFAVALDRPVQRAPNPGESAHAWALDGEPLRNSTVGASHYFLDCPVCGDVILDVVSHRSGTLDVPRNIYSPLGHAWYARCPVCGWTSPDAVSEWDVLDAVNAAKKSRSEP